MTDNQAAPFPSPEQRGLYVGLTVNGQTGAMTSFFTKLPGSYGNPIDPGTAHITMLEPAESAIDVWTDRDLGALGRAEGEIARYLGSMPLSELVLSPDGDSLAKFKRHIGIPVVKSAFLEGMRTHIGEVVKKELKVTIPAQDKFKPHLSVTRIRRGKPKIRPHFPQAPSRIHVKGYRIGQDVLSHQASRSRSKQPYRNQPGSHRHR